MREKYRQHLIIDINYVIPFNLCYFMFAVKSMLKTVLFYIYTSPSLKPFLFHFLAFPFLATRHGRNFVSY